MENLFKRTIGNPLVTWLGRSRERRRFSAGPIIIGGCGRSGTTLLLAILGAHPHIFTFPRELVAIADWKPDPQHPGKSMPARLDRLYRELLISHLPRGGRRWCEKTPRNVRHVSEILEYWPTGRFIHMVRDPRDVCTSRHPTDPNSYWVSPGRWVQDVTAGWKYRKAERVLTLRYEDLVEEFQNTLGNICEFLDEPLVPELTDWVTHTTVKRNKAWSQPARRVHRDSLRKWERPEHQQRLEEILAYPGLTALMDELGYQS